MDMSGPVAIFLFFLLLLVDMFFYGFDAAIAPGAALYIGEAEPKIHAKCI